MKIVKILGGLGNQMFQYALVIALKKNFPNEEIKIDTSCFRGYPLHNGYELERIFNIHASHASFRELAKLTYPYGHYRLWQIGKRVLPSRKTMITESPNGEYDNSVLLTPKSCYYDGYWQNERYFIDFKEDVIKAFTPKEIDFRNECLAQKLAANNSVSLHIRRGDYVNNPLYKGICDESYYANAIKNIMAQTDVEMFCVFSNEMDWCRQHLPKLVDGKPIEYVDWNTKCNSYKDMYLMSHCRHNIIANSSFSWWGAWLNNNKDKIVICPPKWNNMKGSRFEIPAKWQKS